MVGLVIQAADEMGKLSWMTLALALLKGRVTEDSTRGFGVGVML